MGERPAGRAFGGVRARLTALAAAAALALAPAAAVADTLADALSLAYKNSNLLDQNRALLRATDEDVAQAVAAMRPVINFAVTSTFAARYPSPQTLTSAASLTLDITLFDFGANQLALDAAKETVLATREALKLIEQNVLLAAVEAYMTVIRANQFVALRQNNVRVITQELRAARDRFEVGEVTRTDVSIAESRLAAARAALAAAQGDLHVAREAYKAAVGTYPGRLGAPARPPVTARSLDGAKAIAVRGHPAIIQARHAVAAAELNIERALAAMKPRVTGRIAGQVDGLGPMMNSVGVALTAPIYAGGRLSSAYRKAVALRDAERANLLQTTLIVGQNVGNAWARLAVARASVEATQRQVRAAQVAYRGVSEEARLGARTTLDVLDAEQELLDARSAAISAQTDQYIAIYALLASMGLLTVEHLGLGIVTYDPAAYYEAVEDAPLRKVSPQGERLDRILNEVYGK